MDTFRRRPPVIDMTPDGTFREPAPASSVDRVLARVGGVAILVAIAAAGLLLASIATVILGLLLPIAIGAAVVAMVTIWWRVRRARSRGEVPAATRFTFVRR